MENKKLEELIKDCNINSIKSAITSAIVEKEWQSTIKFYYKPGVLPIEGLTSKKYKIFIHRDCHHEEYDTYVYNALGDRILQKYHPDIDYIIESIYEKLNNDTETIV